MLEAPPALRGMVAFLRGKAGVILRALATVCLLALVALAFYLHREFLAIRDNLRQLTWDIYVLENKDENLVQPTVGVIQFLRRGYSITFQSANYSQEGLTLTGQLGNPSQLWLSNIALNMSAQPPFYSLRERQIAGQLTIEELLNGPRRIGHAQTVIEALGPGRQTTFKLTIPNVRQTEERITLKVWFSGERYSY